jgi:predicted dehydrogenase
MKSSNAITFTPDNAGWIRKIVIVGAGQVVKERICRAIKELRARGYRLDEVIACSLERESPLDGSVDAYHPVTEDGFLPFDWLHERGALSKETLWLIATPSKWHVPYTIQLAGRARVAIEKPVAAGIRQAMLLAPFTNSKSDVHQMDHKLFNVSALALIDQCRANPKLLERAAYIEGLFYERAGFSQGREQENCISDVQWHLLTCLAACYQAMGEPFEIVVDDVSAGTHTPDPDEQFAAPTVWTASRIFGRVIANGRQVPLDLRQAKGSPCDRKGLVFVDSDGQVIGEADLGESGHQAHTRMIQALLQPVVDLRHTLKDAIAVMRLIDQARALAVGMGEYEFGRLPEFLTGTVSAPERYERTPVAQPQAV